MSEVQQSDAKKECHFPLEKVCSIRITSRVNRIHILGNDKEKISLRWKDTAIRKTEVSCENGVLNVAEQSVVAFYEMFALIELGREKDVYLYLPDSFEGNLTVHSSHEAVYVSGIHLNGTIKIESETGEIVISESQAENWVLVGRHGGIRADGLRAGKNIEAESVTGAMNILLDDSTQIYAVQANTEHGNCRLPEGGNTVGVPVRIVSSSGNISVRLKTKNEKEDKKMSYCVKCGALLGEGETHCVKCGTETADAAKKETWGGIADALRESAATAVKGFGTIVGSNVQFAMEAAEASEKRSLEGIADAAKESTKTAMKGLGDILESGVQFAADVVIPSVIQGTKDVKEALKKEEPEGKEEPEK